jgi:hypothetical protein
MPTATSGPPMATAIGRYDSFATTSDDQSGLLLGFDAQNCCENAGEYSVNTLLLKSQLLCQLS